MLALFPLSLLFLTLLLQDVRSDSNFKRADNACSFGTTTIIAFSDATAITSCATLTGEIVIATDTGRSSGNEDFVIDGPTEIQGSLQAIEAHSLKSISSTTLKNVTDFLYLQNTWILDVVNLTELQAVGQLELDGVPNLTTFSLLKTLEQVTSIRIVNTQISELTGFNMQTVEYLTLGNNFYLNTVNLQPFNVTWSLEIGFNGENLDLSMPNVQSAPSVTFANISSINLPRLTRVGDHLWPYGNYITSLDGMPSLQSIDQDLQIYDNPNMVNMSLTLLQSIGQGLQIVNNSALTTIDNLYGLATIGGDVQISGDFSEIDFPALSSLNGSLNITSDKAMSCNLFDDLYRDDVVKRNYYCQTANDTGVSNRSLSDSHSGSGSAGTSTSSSSAVQVGVGVGVGFGGSLVIGGVLRFLLRRRQAAKHPKMPRPAEVDGSEVDRAAMVTGGERHELQSPAGELPTGSQSQELPASHGESELNGDDSSKSPATTISRHEMP